MIKTTASSPARSAGFQRDLRSRPGPFGPSSGRSLPVVAREGFTPSPLRYRHRSATATATAPPHSLPQSLLHHRIDRPALPRIVRPPPTESAAGLPAGIPSSGRGKPIRTGLEGVTAGTDFEGSGVHSTLVVAYESGAAPTGSEPETVLAWTESSPIEFEWEKRRLVLEATADPEVAFEFVEEGIDPVEFSVVVAGAAFTPAVPWL